MKNPFYVTLKAQKEERDKFIDFYASGAILGLPPTSPTSDGDNKLISFAIESPTSADGNPMIEDDQPVVYEADDPTNDLFKQTQVDIADEPSDKKTMLDNKGKLS